MMLPIQSAAPTPPVEEGRFGFGTTPAVEAFFKTILSYKESHENILLVNLSTLLRNNISTTVYVDGKKIESKEKPKLDTASVVRKTQQHMVEIANEFAEICNTRFKDRKHHVLFYLTDPSRQVPKEWVRPHTSESATNLDAVTAAFCRVMKSNDQTQNNVMMHVRLADKMKVPSYRGLEEALKGIARYDVGFHMISHFPLDYHTSSITGRKGHLYRSHTGQVVDMTPSELGKTVFKIPDVPFYPITHVLLGDKVLIKGSLPKKERDRLVELAKTNRWGLRTNEYVSIKVKEYGFSLPYTLN